MSKCQMNKYKAGGRCGGEATAERGGGEASNAKAVSGALANLMAAREMQDRAFAPLPAKQEALVVKQVAQPRPEKKECIDIILAGDF